MKKILVAFGLIIMLVVLLTGCSKKLDHTNEMNFGQFFEKQPSSPVKFWVTVSSDSWSRDYYNVKAVINVSDGVSSGVYRIICEKDFSSDEKAIYDVALSAKNQYILIEIPQMDHISTNDYLIKKAKFIQLDPTIE
jgi:hypothetical protein